MAKGFVTAVQLLIVAESEAEAADAISNILSDYEMADGVLKDWSYLKYSEPHLYPLEIADDYKEGDFLC